MAIMYSNWAAGSLHKHPRQGAFMYSLHTRGRGALRWQQRAQGTVAVTAAPCMQR